MVPALIALGIAAIAWWLLRDDDRATRAKTAPAANRTSMGTFELAQSDGCRLLGWRQMSELPGGPFFIHHIDRDDVICWVNEEWQKFAESNGASAPLKSIGTSLWRSISGPTVVHLYQQLIASVRENQRQIVFPFRCDSPTLSRFMFMKMAPLPDSGVEFVTWTEKQVPRSCSVGFASDASPDEGQLFLRMCSWCRKIDCNGTWREIAEAIEEQKLFEADAVPQLTHTICPLCLDQFRNYLA